MNKEAVPLLVAVAVPFLLVVTIFLYFYGYDITAFFKKIDAIYYVIVLPFALGLLVAIFKLKKD